MAKRFTDTNKYKTAFFRSLPGPYKLLWDFLYHDCDHAGIWIVDFEIAQIRIGVDMQVKEPIALELFNKDEQRVISIDNGKKWFVPGFIEFQYGHLSTTNRAHSRVIGLLKKYGLLNELLEVEIKNKPDASPLQGAKEEEEEKEKLEEEKKSENSGNSFWQHAINTNSVKIDKGAGVLLVPELLAIWKFKKPGYVTTDDCAPALRRIGEMISIAKGMKSYTDFESVNDIKAAWIVIVEFILTDNLYKDFQLSQVAKYLNNIISKMKSQAGQPAATGKNSVVDNNLNQANSAREHLKNKYNNEQQETND
jgi:hypothetical protein